MKMIGREKEKEQILDAYNSEYSQFVVVYGRRRVGKTFLIREIFDYKFTFTYMGIKKIPTKMQLQQFSMSLKRQGLTTFRKPRNWFEAFDLLIELLESKEEKRKVIFLDELPWMDAPRSHFISAFEHFWNGWASARRDILLIICGSASSWIIKKVFKNHGGLYNRVNIKIHLQPFTLYECELMAKEMQLPIVKSQIVEWYMIMGGVPYYWSKLKPKLSINQNIDALFCSEEGELRYEYEDLFASIFESPDKHIAVIEALATKHQGLTRESILQETGLTNNGSLSGVLEDLEHCGFIRKYCHLSKDVKDAMYQLIDNYTIFYYSFLKGQRNLDENYWIKLIGTPKYNAWVGLAFERVCLLHIPQIKRGLGISGGISSVHSWYVKGTKDKPGAQIDMLINRADKVVNICEMKFSTDVYSLKAEDRTSILNKMARLAEFLPPSRVIVPVMITPFGVKRNENSDLINWEVTLDQLMEL